MTNGAFLRQSGAVSPKILETTAILLQIRDQEAKIHPEETAPPPPPLPPPSTPTTDTPQPMRRSQSRQSMASIKSSGEKMQEELSSVLSLVREKQKRLDIKQTPETYIDQKSSAEDVKAWLAAKAFDQHIQDKFKGVNGHDLLGINKAELERICGRVEGKRLHSQLNIQRSASGFQTARTTELKAILAKARQKIEIDKHREEHVQ